MSIISRFSPPSLQFQISPPSLQFRNSTPSVQFRNSTPSRQFGHSYRQSSKRYRGGIMISCCDSSKLMEFPHSSAPVRKLMVDLVSEVENRLSSDLLPCTLPPDVQLYRNPNGSAVSSLLIRSAAPSSPIDFMLASWLHSKLPNGAALNITSLSCYLKDTTASPNFLMDIIQPTPTSMVVVLDLFPRKDSVLHPEYLKSYYEDTQLEKQRQLLYTLPEVRPYFSPSLYVRSALSPTAILVRINSDSGSRLDEVVETTLHPVAKAFLTVWFDCLALAANEVGEEERRLLKERDGVFKRQTIQIDLGNSLPMMFGEETAGRVLEVIAHYFKT